VSITVTPILKFEKLLRLIIEGRNKHKSEKLLKKSNIFIPHTAVEK